MLGKYSDKRIKLMGDLQALFWCIIVFSVFYLVPNRPLAVGIAIAVAALGIYVYINSGSWFSGRNNYSTGKVSPTATGFTLQRNSIRKQISWNDIKQFEWLGSWICFEMHDGACICIKENLEGVKSLLPTMPLSKAATKNVVDILKLTMDEENPAQGELCKICGFMAVHNTEFYIHDAEKICMVCDNEPWNPKFAEPEKDYVRKKALEHFKIYTEYERVNFHPKEDDNKQNASWIPPVTEAEVREYSAQNNGFHHDAPYQSPNTIPVNVAKCLPCMVCGFFAIPHPGDPAAEEDKTCRVCYSEDWSVSLGMNEMDYLRECQLEHFSILNPEDKVIFYPRDEDEYRAVPHWRPGVTEEEVLEYSRREYFPEA